MNIERDKFFSIMGDSISTYEGYIPRDYPSFYVQGNQYLTNVYGYDDTWWGQTIKHFRGHLLVNNSWSGSTVCKLPEMDQPSYASGDERTGGLGDDERSPDHIIIYMGTNDRGLQLPLQSKEESDMSVIENAYGAMLDKIKKNYPCSEVWCCTLPRTVCSRNYHLNMGEREKQRTCDICRLIKILAEARGCRIIDLYPEECNTSDGLHPNADGMKTISEAVIRAIKNA